MKKLISLVAITSLILTSCGSDKIEEMVKVDYKQVKVKTIKKEVFEEQLKLIGKVSPLMETSVSALVAGVIKEINADVGKIVKKGDILASIDLDSTTYRTSLNNANSMYLNTLNSYEATQESIRNDLKAAEVALNNAKINRDNTYTTTAKQLEITQTQLKNIQKTKENTKITTTESLKNAELQLENAKTNLDNFEKNSKETTKSLEDKKKGLYDTIKVNIENTLATINSSLTQADILLGVSDKNKYLNDNYEVYLGAKETTTKIEAENSYREAQGYYEKIIASKDLSSEQKIEEYLNNVIISISNTSDLYDRIIKMLDNTIISSSFNQTQLDGQKSIFSGKQTAILTIKGTVIGLNNSLTDLKNTISSTKTNLDSQKISLQNAINIAQTGYNNLLAGNNSQLDNVSGNETLLYNQLDSTNAAIKSTRDGVDNALLIAQANYNSIKAKLEASESQTKTQLDSAKGGKDLAQIQMDNTKIIAPFDGIIIAKNVEKGGLVNIGTPAFIIGTNDSIKIKLELNSENIEDIKIGHQVSVKKNNNSYSGVITLASPASDSATKMFKVEISFLTRPDSFNIGDFVDIYIKKEKGNKKVLQVPFSSVVSMGQGDYSVFIIKNGQAKSIKVKIGEQNSEYIEIIDGLKEGDKVITSGTLNISDGDSLIIDN